MAASVYTGKEHDFAYTNSTGGNVRVIIHWLHVVYTSSQYVKLVWGNVSGGGNEDYVEHTLGDGNSSGTFMFGKNVAVAHAGDRALNNAYATMTFAAPTEIFLANGHVFRITATDDNDVLGYNVVIIPE